MPLADFSLKDKVAVITGASRGIGEAIARAFVEQGATVVISSRKQESLDTLADSINRSGGQCVPVACHTGDPDAIAKLFEKVQADFGRCDVLVNNAATNPYFGPIVNTELSAFEKTIEVNIRGYFLMCQRAAKMMMDHGGGSIVNIASVAGITPAPMQGVYSITKAAVISMTKSFAIELGSTGVRCNAICPGVVETKFASVLINTPEIYEQFIHRVPMQRHAQPSEMTGLAVYLASDAASYTTGAVFVSDGGMTA